MSLNKLPNGDDAPKYAVTAVSFSGEEKTETLTEWWYDGKLIEPIEESAEHYFYDVFDKVPFTITEIKHIEEQPK